MGTKKLPRGFWDSAEGRKALDKFRSGKVAAGDLARELKTTEAAIYNAASKRNRFISATSPMLVDQGLIDRIIRFSEDILGEAVTTKIRQLEHERDVLVEKNRELEEALETANRQSQDRAATLESLQHRLTERVLRSAGPATAD